MKDRIGDVLAVLILPWILFAFFKYMVFVSDVINVFGWTK